MNGRLLRVPKLRSFAACGAIRRVGVGMSEASKSLFVETAIAAVSRDVRTGVLPYQALQTMIREKEIWATEDINPAQLQPASMDLRLGPVAYRVRASFLPGPDSTVLDRVKELDGYAIDLTQGAVLEKGCVYVVPLLEHLELKSGITAVTNPKSSTGRLDILTRMIADSEPGVRRGRARLFRTALCRDHAEDLQHRRAHGLALEPDPLPPRLAGAGRRASCNACTTPATW